MLVRSVVGASSDSNATAITLSSFLKDDRWPDFHRVAQCAAVTSLTAIQPQGAQQPDPFIDQNPPELDDVIAAAPAPVVLAQNSPDGDAPTLTPPPGLSDLAANGFTQLSGD